MSLKIVLRRELTGRILDIGGGGECVIGRIYGPQVTAIDNHQAELDEVKADCTKLLMDATAMTFPDACFDHVTSFYTLMYMTKAEQAAVIGEATRVLRPGGTLVVWDTEIASAYPEPFLAELDIDAAGVRICTTYGIVKLDTQDAPGVIATAEQCGLRLTQYEQEKGHFHLQFVK